MADTAFRVMTVEMFYKHIWVHLKRWLTSGYKTVIANERAPCYLHFDTKLISLPCAHLIKNKFLM